MRTYRALDPARVIDTIATLQHRVSERFPGAGLGSVCAELLLIAKDNSARARRISRRSFLLRLLTYVLLGTGGIALVWIARLIDFSRTSADNVFTVLQGVEAAANLVVLVGAARVLRRHHRGTAEAQARLAGAERAALHRACHRHAPAHQGPELDRERGRQYAVLAGAQR